ncbi:MULTISPECIES: helix-turn-helix domain-containing protein [Streptomyces]|uniref:HTH-type transcriptional regulator PuuR n=1 Tax=Streptomyces chartreusis NRRL 3882 TaxID=1079985 RepID=A0A2N9B2M2_STRCX|nr:MULTISPECIES: XRE family transcriptional regulator [Streptomyces]MYS93053.1 helix-turn-helix domain-containing protein [Streptomyces sp. SID5464]SOR77591.1 HTH-type transcriptional regulator PuuR [Streptomyces chartreusis NRRL 3882]
MRSDEVDPVDTRLGARLAELRAEHGWSLGELADRSGVSRSTLSRAERAETSPTASLLNRLCAVYGRTMSQLLSEVEAEPAPVLRAADQLVWRDQASGFVRRSVSPPHSALRGELVEARLSPGADIAYDRPPVTGLEQHIWVLAGALDVTAQDTEHHLGAGDCLRMRVWGPTRFRCAAPDGVRYLLAVVRP